MNGTPRPGWPVLALMLVLSALLGAAGYAAIARLVPGASGDRARTEAIVRDYVLANPEILPEAMRNLADKEAGKAVAANRSRIITPFPGAEAGNPNGDVTVVAFMDYACGYCRASLPALAELARSDGRVRIVYRELPILSPASRSAAEWALAAAQQGRFKAFHDALYAQGQLDDGAVERAAAAAGIDRAAAARVAQSQPVAQEIAGNLQLAGQLGMTGTPAWVVGDRVLNGVQSLEQLRAAVAAARKAG